jgi:hypothetical protein
MSRRVGIEVESNRMESCPIPSFAFDDGKKKKLEKSESSRGVKSKKIPRTTMIMIMMTMTMVSMQDLFCRKSREETPEAEGEATATQSFRASLKFAVHR